MKQKAAAMGRSQEVISELMGEPLAQGDPVVIRWRFSFLFKDGGRMRQEEIAWRGQKIASETFFYDPGRRKD